MKMTRGLTIAGVDWISYLLSIDYRVNDGYEITFGVGRLPCPWELFWYPCWNKLSAAAVRVDRTRSRGKKEIKQ